MLYKWEEEALEEVNDLYLLSEEVLTDIRFQKLKRVFYETHDLRMPHFLYYCFDRAIPRYQLNPVATNSGIYTSVSLCMKSLLLLAIHQMSTSWHL